MVATPRGPGPVRPGLARELFFPFSKFKSMTPYRRQQLARKLAHGCFTLSTLFFSFALYAQDGTAGINDANQKVRSYFAAGTNLMYAIGAIVGLIGAVKVYNKWNSGDHDTGKVAAAWFGSCVFLVIVSTVIRAFFGI